MRKINILIVGRTGSGKSTIGNILSHIFTYERNDKKMYIPFNESQSSTTQDRKIIRKTYTLKNEILEINIMEFPGFQRIVKEEDDKRDFRKFIVNDENEKTFIFCASSYLFKFRDECTKKRRIFRKYSFTDIGDTPVIYIVKGDKNAVIFDDDECRNEYYYKIFAPLLKGQKYNFNEVLRNEACKFVKEEILEEFFSSIKFE